jgi:hypothetical protein
VAIAKERENECLAIERQRYNKGTAKCWVNGEDAIERLSEEKTKKKRKIK